MYRKSPINYTGNKYRLLSQIIPLFPDDIETFIDLFGGSGTVLLNVDANKYIYNDINPYIASILKGLCALSANDAIDLIQNIINEYGLNSSDKEPFNKLRYDYNNGKDDWLHLYALMCFSYNGQFRFNNNHKYNSSFGERCFNQGHIDRIKSLHTPELKISFYNQPFEKLDLCSFYGFKNLVYCDPPYYNSLCNFNDGKRGFEGWTERHEKNLLKLLDDLNEHGTRFALSNNLQYNNNILKEWLDNSNYNVYHLDINYGSCNHIKKNRRKGDEILVTNYDAGRERNADKS